MSAATQRLLPRSRNCSAFDRPFIRSGQRRESRHGPAGHPVRDYCRFVRHFDVVIIGSGSGNSLPDERFAGLDIAIIEEGVFGGTCLNVGCIPTKMYVYAADVAREIADASRFGIDAVREKVRWTDIRDRVFGRIDPISEGGR